MSDFLASLIDRAVNRETVLERRRRSLFEPAPTQTVARSFVSDTSAHKPREPAGDLEVAAERESIAPPHRPRPHRPRRIRDSSTENDEAETKPPEPREMSDRPLARRSHAAQEPGHPTEEIKKSETPHRGRKPAADIDESIRATQHGVSSQQTVSVLNAGREHETRLERKAESKVAPERQSTNGVNRPVSAEPVPARPSLTSRLKSVDQPPADSLKPAPIRPGERPALPRAPRAASRLESMRTPPLPVDSPPINVTIGRLEIRANSNANSKPGPRKPASPRLSLDDYLRSRNGGAR